MKIKKHIQGRIMFQKMKLLVWIGILAAVALFLLVMIYSSYAGYLFGLKNISTNAKIKSFYNSSFYISNLHFDNVIETDMTFDITTTSTRTFTFFNATLGFMAPFELPPTQSTTTYHLYLLENDDNLTVLCSSTPGIDFSQNVLRVSNKNKDINKKIIAAFSDSVRPVYVFYYAGSISDRPNLILPAIFAFFVAAFCVIAYFKPIRKASRLGKQICRLGDYDEMVRSLNEQVADALYKSSSLIVCKDYLILEKNDDKNTSTDIVPIKDIVSVTSVPDEKYPNEIIEMTVSTSSESGMNTYVFKVYDIDTEQMILNLCLE